MGDCFNNRLYRHVLTLLSQGCGGGGEGGITECGKIQRQVWWSMEKLRGSLVFSDSASKRINEE